MMEGYDRKVWKPIHVIARLNVLPFFLYVFGLHRAWLVIFFSFSTVPCWLWDSYCRRFGSALHRAGYMMLAFGATLNVTAVLANGFRMPAFGYAFIIRDELHSRGTTETHFKILCDWIGNGTVRASLGDLIIGASLLILSLAYFRRRRARP
jgi:hypothetical protein